MEVTVKSLTEVSQEIQITASQSELTPHFNKAYENYRKKIEIRGFRKGKAPIDLVKKLYGDMIEHDSLNEIATDMYKKAVQEKELKPIGEPVLVDIDYKRGENFSFKIQYDIRPKIDLKEYKNIDVEKTIHNVSDKEIEQELLRIQRSNATFEEAEVVASPEYIVTATLQDLDDTGVPIVGKKSENVRFYLADEQLEQPFKETLKSAQKGGEYKVEFEHKHDEHSHKVNTLISVKKVEKVNIPALDDSFVVKITKEKYDKVESFRQHIKEEIINYWKEKSERQVVNSIIQEIIRRHDFQVPESLVRNVLDSLLEDMKNEYPNKRLPSDFDRAKFDENNRTYAIFQSKWALLREELIKAENISISDEDLEKIAESEAEKIKIPKDRLISYYKTSEQIKDRLIGDKLIKILVDSAKIKEVPEKE